MIDDFDFGRTEVGYWWARWAAESVISLWSRSLLVEIHLLPPTTLYAPVYVDLPVTWVALWPRIFEERTSLRPPSTTPSTPRTSSALEIPGCVPASWELAGRSCLPSHTCTPLTDTDTAAAAMGSVACVYTRVRSIGVPLFLVRLRCVLYIGQGGWLSALELVKVFGLEQLEPQD